MYSILLADDEPMVRKGLRLILEKSELPIEDICEADDGAEALSLIAEHFPDIIITDIRMPNLNGLEFCHKICKIYPRSSVVIISGYDDFKFAQEAIKYGVKGYLLKPVNRIMLIQTISEIIDTFRSSEKPMYVSYYEVKVIIEKIEKGLWNNDYFSIQQGIKKLAGFFYELPFNYCKTIAEEVVYSVLKRLSSIGYTLNADIAQLIDLKKENVYSQLEDLLKRLQRELSERRSYAEYNSIQTAMQFISENYYKDITLEDVSDKVGFSSTYFSQLFKAKTGKNFVKFRSDLRMIKAMELMVRPDKSVTEVAYEVGFNNLTYFIRAFKEHTGLTPTEFKKKGVS